MAFQQPLPGQRPPKKKSALPIILVVVVSLVILVPLLGSLFSSPNEVPEKPEKPTYTATSITSDPSDPSSTATSTPTTKPTQTYVPGPPDLNPAEAPFPETYGDMRWALFENPLYAQELAPTECQLGEVDLVNGSVEAIEKHMNEFVACLMMAWHGPVTNAGFELPRPSVTVYTTEITTKCGEVPLYNAVYCSADQQIYYALNIIEIFPPELRQARFVAESVMAHEFGHGIQNRSMILGSEAVIVYEAETEDIALSASRRLEMQADCFAGAFLNSISQSTNLSTQDRQNIEAMFGSLGGTEPYSDDHGMGTNRAWWTRQGLSTKTLNVCETFSVPEERVG